MSDDHKVGTTAIIAIAILLLVGMFTGRGCTDSDNARRSKQNNIDITLTDEAIKALNGKPLELKLSKP